MYQHMEVLVIVNLFFRLFPTASTFIETLSGFFRRAMGLSKLKKPIIKIQKKKDQMIFSDMAYFVLQGVSFKQLKYFV